MRAALTVLAGLAGIGSCATPAWAQAATATVSGLVVDRSGAVVPHAAITVLSHATKLRRETAANGDGRFVVTALPPGRYSLLARRDGFTPVSVPDLSLNVNDHITLRLELHVGSVDETVAVVGSPSRMRTSPAVGTVIDRQFVENLPLNGGSLQSLLMLTPGVVMTPSTSDAPGQFSVNGQRANANYFTVDGVSANAGVSPYWKGDAAGGPNQHHAGVLPALTTLGTTQSLLSVEALEEFKIQTSTYTAEFGRQPGGQMQLVTRSGTNQARGSFYGAFRDEAFDANDWFANQAGLPKGEFRQQLFGGTLGGPIRHDRTFFFASYEGLRLRLPASGTGVVPSLRLREVAAPAVRPLLDAIPLPTGPELLDTDGQPTGFAPLATQHSDPKNQDALGIRLDHTLSPEIRLFGRYSYTPSSDGVRAENVLTERRTRYRTTTVGATLAAGQLTNEVRVNYSHGTGESRQTMDDFGGAVPVDVSAFTTGYDGSGIASGDAFMFFSGFSYGVGLQQSGRSYQQQLNVVDTLSWLLGQHQLKFGVDYRRLAPDGEPPAYGQSAYFMSEDSIRSGRADSVYVSSNAAVRPRFHNLSAFAQDTWRLGSRLTLDLGLRWEFNPPPSEMSGIKPILVQGFTGPETVGDAALAPPDTPLYKTFWTAFAPRLGASYQLSRRPGRETVLRGGFGLYYDLGNAISTAGYNFYPYYTLLDLRDVSLPIRPADVVLPPPPGVTLPIEHDLPVFNPDLKLPYTLQWNVSLERSLGAHQTVTASYVAAAARRLLMTQVLNFSFTGERPNPDFSELDLVSNGPTSDYHALQLQFQRRLTRGLQALVNYTWSHAIDLVSTENSGLELVRGNADFDVRHNLSAAVTFDLPAPKPRVARAILGGWALDGIVHAQSGVPVPVFAEGGYLGPGGEVVSVRPDVVPGVPFYHDDPGVPGGRRFNPAAFTTPPIDPVTGQTRQGTLGRNVLRGLPLQQVDLALRREVRIGGRARLQLRVEAFNLFNQPNFTDYETNAASPSTFGVPTTMMNRGLGGLNPLYQIGGPRSLQFTIKTLF